MFISSCPLRVSLFGGSTDNPVFVERYGYGSVISFACSLKTYITLHEDKLGYNNQGGKYIIYYSKREEVTDVRKIKNELIRIVLDYFRTPPVNVSMTSDAYSQGSGLASSSSYIISLLKCLSMYYKTPMTDVEICEMAYQLELIMNPYCGYQDPYGCGVGGFKRIEFKRGGIVKYNFLNTELFNQYDAHLVFTGVTRNSKNVLKDVTANIQKSKPLLETVERAHDAFMNKNYDEFNVTYHYSLFHQYSKRKEKSYQDFLNFVKNSHINKNYEILLVSGSNKKKNFDSVDVLAYLKKEKNLKQNLKKK